MGGRPKALLTDADGSSLAGRVVERLRGAGCAEVMVVIGAAAEAATRLLRPTGAVLVEAVDWAEGMGSSLRAGLQGLQRQSAAGAALVTLVDLPDVSTDVMRRVIEEWRAAGARPDALARATYAGTPGHPVLIGRRHWQPLVEGLSGDVGAQPYLSRRRVHEVSCDDLATGRDLDRLEDVDQWRAR